MWMLKDFPSATEDANALLVEEILAEAKPIVLPWQIVMRQDPMKGGDFPNVLEAADSPVLVSHLWAVAM